MKIGIALGGGGAKGLAHIGVLEVLEEHGIRPAYVAGTSIGAIVGAIYCLDGTAHGLKNKAESMIQMGEFKDFRLEEFYADKENILEKFKKEVLEKFYFGRLIFKKSHVRLENAQKLFATVFGDKTFNDFRIKFICNALDIQSGDEILFDKGRVADAVWASCAIPGLLPPFVKENRILVDGGVIDNIPVRPVKKIGARTVLAVYLSEKPHFKEEPDTGYKIAQRSFSYMKYHFDQHILAEADFAINPEVGKFHWAEFSELDELVQKGREATTKNIKAIKSITSFWHRVKKII